MASIARVALRDYFINTYKHYHLILPENPKTLNLLDIHKDNIDQSASIILIGDKLEISRKDGLYVLEHLAYEINNPNSITDIETKLAEWGYHASEQG